MKGGGKKRTRDPAAPPDVAAASPAQTASDKKRGRPIKGGESEGGASNSLPSPKASTKKRGKAEESLESASALAVSSSGGALFGSEAGGDDALSSGGEMGSPVVLYGGRKSVKEELNLLEGVSSVANNVSGAVSRVIEASRDRRVRANAEAAAAKANAAGGLGSSGVGFGSSSSLVKLEDHHQQPNDELSLGARLILRSTIEGDGGGVKKVFRQSALVGHLKELLVSLTVQLFPMCFTIDNSSIAYPYEEPYLQFVRAIDNQRLTPDILDILSEKDVHFYDGCIVVELRDQRVSSSVPQVHRVLLRPGYDTVIRDASKMAASNEISTDLDLLEVEKRMLLAMSKPLCLEPDPFVFFVSAMLNFNARKFSVPSTVAQKLSVPVERKPAAGVLYSFLLQRHGGRKPSLPGGGGGGRPLAMYGVPQPPPVPMLPAMSGGVGGVGGAGNNSNVGAPPPTPQPTVIPNFPEPASGGVRRTPINFADYLNRDFRFDRPPNRKVFFSFRITQQKGAPVYGGIFRVGASPDTGSNGHRTVFTLGSKASAISFLEQLLFTFGREGYHKWLSGNPAQQQQQLQHQQHQQQQLQQQQQQLQAQAPQLQHSLPSLVTGVPVVTSSAPSGSGAGLLEQTSGFIGNVPIDAPLRKASSTDASAPPPSVVTTGGALPSAPSMTSSTTPAAPASSSTKTTTRKKR